MHEMMASLRDQQAGGVGQGQSANAFFAGIFLLSDFLDIDAACNLPERTCVGAQYLEKAKLKGGLTCRCRR